MKVCVLGDPHGLGSHIASEFCVSAVGLDDQPPADCDGVVMVVGADPAPSARQLTDMPEAEWRNVAEATPLRAILALQRARDALLPHGGTIVVVAPNVGLVGAAGLSHYAAAVEAVRALAKSAARQWASDRISVNLIVVPLALIAGDVGDLVRHVGSASRKDADLLDALARSVDFVLTGAGPGLTGSTLAVDGGAVMVP